LVSTLPQEYQLNVVKIKGSCAVCDNPEDAEVIYQKAQSQTAGHWTSTLSMIRHLVRDSV